MKRHPDRYLCPGVSCPITAPREPAPHRRYPLILKEWALRHRPRLGVSRTLQVFGKLGQTLVVATRSTLCTAKVLGTHDASWSVPALLSNSHQEGRSRCLTVRRRTRRVRRGIAPSSGTKREARPFRLGVRAAIRDAGDPQAELEAAVRAGDGCPSSSGIGTRNQVCIEISYILRCGSRRGSRVRVHQDR
jgi:hypothetical protein